jgi:hypothetical protein
MMAGKDFTPKIDSAALGHELGPNGTRRRPKKPILHYSFTPILLLIIVE